MSGLEARLPGLQHELEQATDHMRLVTAIIESLSDEGLADYRQTLMDLAEDLWEDWRVHALFHDWQYRLPNPLILSMYVMEAESQLRSAVVPDPA